MIVNKEILKNLWDILNKKRLIDFKLLKQLIPSYKGTEIYIVDILGEQGDKNIKSLADMLYMTKGAVSKLAKKLSDRGIVSCYKRDGNKRDVYLTLTKSGRTDYERHCKMTDALDDDLQIAMTDDERYETNRVLKILREYNCKLDVQMKKFDAGLL